MRSGNTPVDAIPDLTDTQVIVRASFPRQAPQVVEGPGHLSADHRADVGSRCTYGAWLFHVRGMPSSMCCSMDDTDPYWARSRVLEYLSQAESGLAGERDCRTGTGRHRRWLGLQVRPGRPLRHSRPRPVARDAGLVSQIRTSVGARGFPKSPRMGGMVRQYQVAIDPNALRVYGLTLGQLQQAIRRGSAEAGGSLIEMGEAEYMVRGRRLYPVTGRS